MKYPVPALLAAAATVTFAASFPVLAGTPAASSPPPVAAAVGFLREHDGMVLRGNATGRLAVLILDEAGDEIWALDGVGNVVDVGFLSLDAAREHIVAAWRRAPEPFRYRIGDPFPAVSTGRRYEALDFVEWLSAQDRDVGLPFADLPEVAFRFLPDGLLAARGGGDYVPGRWRLSRGGVLISLDGLDTDNLYDWRTLAARTGWPGLDVGDLPDRADGP